MKTKMNVNSLKTYHELREALGRQEMNVYWAALSYPGKTRRELEDLTGIRQSSISGRVNKLIQGGLIEDRHDGTPCSITGRPAGRLFITRTFKEMAA
jgi:DNA-binding MarR family transcriptional regulator